MRKNFFLTTLSFFIISLPIFAIDLVEIKNETVKIFTEFNLSNPLCILNNANFNIVDVSFKDKFIDILNRCQSSYFR